MEGSYFVYILTNKSHTLYIGITSDLVRRVWEHKNKFVSSFTCRYKIDELIYFEEYKYINEALRRKKRIKGWGRKKKVELIKSVNPKFEETVV